MKIPLCVLAIVLIASVQASASDKGIVDYFLELSPKSQTGKELTAVSESILSPSLKTVSHPDWKHQVTQLCADHQILPVDKPCGERRSRPRVG
jgi:hypothetical protein